MSGITRTRLIWAAIGDVLMKAFYILEKAAHSHSIGMTSEYLTEIIHSSTRNILKQKPANMATKRIAEICGGHILKGPSPKT